MRRAFCPFRGGFLALGGAGARKISGKGRVWFAIARDIVYNSGMKIMRIQPPAGLPAEADFSWQEKTVQGARCGRADGARIVRSPRRFKLFCEGRDELLFLDGNGHFKWARGETPFAAGQAFCIEGEGEYEVNGPCTFIAVQKQM